MYNIFRHQLGNNNEILAFGEKNPTTLASLVKSKNSLLTFC